MMRRIVTAILTLTVVAVWVSAYLLGGALDDLQAVQQQQEYRSDLRVHQFCESQNETRGVLALVLDELAAPRDDDGPGELEERMRLRAQVDPYVQPHDCPPRPEEP